MNLTHAHLLLNHFPTVGMVIGVGLFAFSMWRRNTALQHTSLGLLCLIALIALPAYLTGGAAQQMLATRPEISASAMERHLDAATVAFVSIEFTGFAAWLALWQWRGTSRPARWSSWWVLGLSVVTLALMTRAANLGGEIRHPEIGVSAGLADRAVTLGTSWLSKASIAELSLNTWLWPALEAIHFVGLALLFGIVLTVHLRVLGLLKRVSLASGHRLLPWAILGLAVNTATGILFFIVTPEQYTQNTPFQLKILPITLFRAVRFFWIAPPGALRGVGEALRLTLAASALNVFLPAKSGDLIKSYVVARGRETTTGMAIAIVVYERLADLFGLIFWCLLGWIVARPQGTGVPSAFWLLLGGAGAACVVLISSEGAATWSRGLLARTLAHDRLRRLRELAAGWPDLLHSLGGRRPWIVLASVVLWLVHLGQIWLFTVALAVDMPFMLCASLSAVALMAGQLPFTFAGLGTRDVALVLLLSRYMAPESAAAMGILIATRSFLPPLLGLPVIHPYVSSVIHDARRWRREMAAL